LASADALFSRSLTELTDSLELSRLRTTAVDCRLGEHGKELPE
jgi:hypothetical protein